MLTSDIIIARLRDKVPGLGEVSGAIELAALLEAKPQPRPKPIAHVVPAGLRGGTPRDVTGGFIQAIDVSFAVFVTFATVNDPKGAKAQAVVDVLLVEIIAAICGWAPLRTTGVFRLLGAGPRQVKPGLVVYAIEFAIQDQLRI
jgi:hypothetical protein